MGVNRDPTTSPFLSVGKAPSPGLSPSVKLCPPQPHHLPDALWAVPLTRCGGSPRPGLPRCSVTLLPPDLWLWRVGGVRLQGRALSPQRAFGKFRGLQSSPTDNRAGSGPGSLPGHGPAHAPTFILMPWQLAAASLCDPWRPPALWSLPAGGTGVQTWRPSEPPAAFPAVVQLREMDPNSAHAPPPAAVGVWVFTPSSHPREPAVTYWLSSCGRRSPGGL